MYHAAKCLRCFNTSYSRILHQHNGLATTANDDVVNLLTDTLKSNRLRSNPVQSNAVTWGVMQTRENSKRGKKGKKRMIKNNGVQSYVPMTSNAFSDMNALKESLKIRLNSQFSSLLPIQEKVLPKSLQNK